MAYGSGIASRWLKLPLVLEENGNHLTVMETLGYRARKSLRRKIAIWIMNRAVRIKLIVLSPAGKAGGYFIEDGGPAGESHHD